MVSKYFSSIVVGLLLATAGASAHDQSIPNAGEAAMGVGAATVLDSHAVAEHTQGPVPGRKLLHFHLPCKKFLGCHPVEKGFARAGQIIGAAEAVGGAAATAYGAYNHDQSIQNAGEAAMGVGAATGLGSTAGYRYAEGPFQRGINDMKTVTGLGRKLLQS